MQRLLLDLAHPLTCEPELQRQNFQRLRLATVQAETCHQHLAFARRQVGHAAIEQFMQLLAQTQVEGVDGVLVGHLVEHGRGGFARHRRVE